MASLHRFKIAGDRAGRYFRLTVPVEWARGHRLRVSSVVDVWAADDVLVVVPRRSPQTDRVLRAIREER